MNKYRITYWPGSSTLPRSWAHDRELVARLERQVIRTCHSDETARQFVRWTIGHPWNATTSRWALLERFNPSTSQWDSLGYVSSAVSEEEIIR